MPVGKDQWRVRMAPHVVAFIVKVVTSCPCRTRVMKSGQTIVWKKKIICQLNVRHILIWSFIINKHNIFEAPLQPNRLNMLTAVILIFIWVHLQVYWLIKKVQHIFFQVLFKSMKIKSMVSPLKYDSPPLNCNKEINSHMKSI